jgi:hypothetical protein
VVTSRYGPHREADAPNAVVVLPDGKYPHPVVVPMPEVLREQRRAINELAWCGEVFGHG